MTDLVLEQQHQRMTAAEFLELPESNQIVQLIDEEVLVSPAPLLEHQNVVLNTAILLKSIVPDGEVFVAPVDVYFDEKNIPQPDVLWVSAKNTRCISVDGKYLKGAPDLIVEVLSIGTSRIDRKKKFDLYEKYGVREYWLTDPLEQYVEVYMRREDSGKLVRMGVFEVDEKFNSPLLGEVEVKQMFGG